MNELLRSSSRIGSRALAYMNGQGGRVPFGNDTPSGSVYANPSGFNGYLELRAMEAAGLTPREVLRAATVEDAPLFRIDGRVGTIDVGKSADLPGGGPARLNGGLRCDPHSDSARACSSARRTQGRAGRALTVASPTIPIDRFSCEKVLI